MKIQMDETIAFENDKKRFKSSLYKPPTAEELNSLRETENLFHSNLFRMQINELLSEISLEEHEIDAYKRDIQDLIQFITSIPSSKERKLSDLSIFKKQNIQVPMSDLCEKLEGSYKFLKASKCLMIGSFDNGTLMKPLVCIDLAVEIPKEYFNERDFLNYRYFLKRILYLSNVSAKIIKKYNGKYECHFISEHSSVYKPDLLLKKSDNNSSSIRIRFVPEESTFKYHRFNPNRSNIRKQWFFNGEQESIDASENTLNPHYNYDVLSDLRAICNNKLIKTHLTSNGLRDGLKLLKLWLYQRRLSVGYGSFSGYIMSMFVISLINSKRINSLMSSYQVIRIVLLNLSQTTWNSKGLTMKVEGDNNDEHCLTLEEYHNYFDVVFLDSCGYFNICSNMSETTYLRVKDEASMAIDFLNNQFIESFDALFIKKFSLLKAFDAIINIHDNGDVFKRVIEKTESSDKQMDFYNNNMIICVSLVEKLIQKSLSNRVTCVFTELVDDLKWTISDEIPKYPTQISIGLRFDHRTYTNQLIKGPQSNAPDAKEFRAFWGDKSELRRFQDSTICEAVYFETENIAQKRQIFAQILRHTFLHHLSLYESNMVVYHSQLNDLISLPHEIVDNYSTGEEKFGVLMSAYDELSKILKNLKDMPLGFTNIQAISSCMRQTEVFCPLPACFKYNKKKEAFLRVKHDQKYMPVFNQTEGFTPYVEPIKVVCMLETSTKWPDDIECIRRLKTAFSIELVRKLRDEHGLLANANIEFSDVFYKGYVFRLIVSTSRELAVMKTSKTQEGLIISRDTEESLKLEKNIFHLTKLTSVLHGLQLEYPHYGAVTRLAKRWISSQLLLDYFNEETIDLICAYLFVHPEPYKAPNSILTGFIRFIELLATFDWKNQALTININNEFKRDDLYEIQLNFQNNRAQLPVIFIATPYDATHRDSKMWTSKEKPSMQIVYRMILLAKECFKNIEQASHLENLKKLFRPNEDMYDVVIQMKPEFCPKSYQRLDISSGTILTKHHNYDPQEGEQAFPIVDFDPVKFYLKQLRDAYDEFALFFHDSCGGTDVYVLWKPKSFQACDAKVSHINGRMQSSTAKTLLPNVEAFIEDFKIIGCDLVKNIITRTEKWKFE